MKVVLLIYCVLFAFCVDAQVPQGIPYQAVARNGQGQPLANLPVKVRFSILDSTMTGPTVYCETHEPTTSAQGLFSVNVGMGNSTIGSFSSINWGVNAKFLKVELDTTASGNNYVDLGTQQMMSVPYALYAGSSKFTAEPSIQNTTHGSYTITNVGSLQYWVVPDGVKQVQINIRGSLGGNGGSVFLDNCCYVVAPGGQGGDCGTFSFIYFVNKNDSIGVFLGNNGSNGNNYYNCGGSNPCQSGSGTAGQSSFVYHNGQVLAEISGGSGGGGSYRVMSCSNCLSLGGNGASGGLVNSSYFVNSGILNFNSSNPMNLGCNQFMIRY